MTEPLAVVLPQRAIREVKDIDAWWEQNRPPRLTSFGRSLN